MFAEQTVMFEDVGASLTGNYPEIHIEVHVWRLNITKFVVMV